MLYNVIDKYMKYMNNILYCDTLIMIYSYNLIINIAFYYLTFFLFILFLIII